MGGGMALVVTGWGVERGGDCVKLSNKRGEHTLSNKVQFGMTDTGDLEEVYANVTTT
jgi:hypothetical protein